MCEPSLILIAGSARSGTTWLARLLDHHPRLLYRHEPDAVLWAPDLAAHPAPHQFDALLPARRSYLRQLTGVHVLKAFGPRPAVRKPYRSWAAHHTRNVLASVLRIAEELPGGWRARRIGIPDLVKRGAPQPIPLLKSVDSVSRVGLFARAAPGARFIHLLRHPCAVVASMLRGRAMGKLHRDFDMSLLHMHVARERGVHAQDVLAMSLPQRLALGWALANDFAITSSQGAGNLRLLRYEDLCADPPGQLRELTHWLGLEFDPRMERAARRSTSGSAADDGFFTLVRDPSIAADRWREALTGEQIDTIVETVRGHRSGRLYC